LGVLGLIAIFMLGMTLWNKKTGLFALAVTSPLFFHVFYSQEVRSYSLLFLLTVLSWWAFVFLLRKPGLCRTLLYAGISSLLIYTHYFGIFVLVSQSVYMAVLLAWLQPQQEGKNEAKLTFSPYLLLMIWIAVTYGLPFILSIVKVPMLIPRVTIITVPAIVLLLAGPAARLRMRYLIPISIATCVFMATILVSRNHYYTYQWKENWRGAVQYVLKNDPSGEYPVVCNYPAYFRAYFWMLRKYPTVINAQFCDPRKDLSDIPVSGGFWFLDAHDMKGPLPGFQQFMGRYFEPAGFAHFKRASAVFFRFKSVLPPAPQTGKKAMESGRPLSRN